MKKIIAAAALFAGILAANPSNAQIKIGAGLMTGMPMGDWADGYGFGIGGGVTGSYMVTEEIDASLTIGYLSFAPKSDFQDFFGNFNVIPIMVSGNYHFMPGESFDFYAGVGLGIFMNSTTVTVLNPFTGDVLAEETVSETEFGFMVPRVGVNYMFNDSFGLDANLGYVVNGDASYLPINVGIVYNLDM